jgi:glycine dehydrogenase subunit 1
VHNILGGCDLGAEYPELDPAVLVCATELRTEEDMFAFRDELARIITTGSQA